MGCCSNNMDEISYDRGELLVELNNISAGYDGKIILDDINMKIFSKDFIGVIGPNGGGKTTLLKIILNIIKPLAGEINIYSDSKNIFGYLPQMNDTDKFFPISIIDVVLSGLMSKKNLWGRYNKEDKIAAEDILKKHGVVENLNTPIGNLSGGQRQRVFLSRALISKPKILILDEPTTFVDNNFEQEFYPMLKNINKDIAIIMVSHDIGTICSHVKSIACVNRALHFHNSNIITEEQLEVYNCPIEIITHGLVPHRVLQKHQ